MAVKLSFDERKWLLKCYWKVENVVVLQRRWRVEFGTPPPRVTITRIRDKFEVDEPVQDVLKGRCERKRSSTDNESVDTVMQVFARSPKKSLCNVFMRLVSINPELIKFCELRNDIPLVTIQTVCRSVRRRCCKCTVAKDGHFEHVLA